MSAPVVEPELPTAEQAMAKAIRILEMAEIETDRQMMERLEKLADSWIMIANLLYANRV